MPGGRPPKPVGLKVVRSGGKVRDVVGHRSIKNAPESAPIAVTDAPAHLEGIALEEWKRLAPECARLGMLTKLSAAKLAEVCVLYSRVRAYDTLCKDLERQNQHQLAVTMGYLNGYLKSYQLWKQAAGEFGMDPSSISKIHTKPPEEKTQLSRFRA